MNRYPLILFILVIAIRVNAQTPVDSLHRLLDAARTDLERHSACRSLYDYYEERNRDSALSYAQQCYDLAEKNGKQLAVIHALDDEAYQYLSKGYFTKAERLLLDAFTIGEKKELEKEDSWPLFSLKFNGNNRLLMLAYTHHIFGILMWQTQNTEQEAFHFREALRISTEIHHPVRMMMASMNLGRSLYTTDSLAAAMKYEKDAIRLAEKAGFRKYLGNVYGIVGNIYLKQGNRIMAIENFYKGVQWAKKENNISTLSNNLFFAITRFYIQERNQDSALTYAKANLQLFQSLGTVTGVQVNLGSIYENLYLSYELEGNRDSTFKYLKLALNTKDSLYRVRLKNIAEFQNLGFAEQLRMKEMEKEKVVYQNRIRSSILIGGLAILLLTALLIFRNNRQKQRSNKQLQKAYLDLKSTQQQLIHAEKMASLGELTAGIAHEIQNPLNFVNNFSEVNKELLQEMKEEISKRNFDEVADLARDIISNEEKISFHGKRADAIVKSMLQHSRGGTGQRELADINALVDECIRLSYHGTRARDKSFNAKFSFEPSKDLPLVKIIPQDIGRVVLNLLNNAFYAVNERKKTSGDPLYEPEVKATTSRTNGKVEICISDNGVGIPPAVLEKIFQPFFTTKPTGEGTGLGLSMSYDIITKAHKGELKVESKEGIGTSFTILLPLT